MNFIKLTGATHGGLVWVNLDGIACITADGTGSRLDCIGENMKILVTETPEQIMEMLRSQTFDPTPYFQRIMESVHATQENIWAGVRSLSRIG